MKHYFSLAALVCLTACQPKTDDLAVFVEETRNSTPVSIEPHPEFTPQPAFEYSAVAMRSPFSRPRNAQVVAVETPKLNCQQPNFSRKKHPLEKFGLDALTLTGVFSTKGTNWALFRANDGSLHKAKRGDYLGLFFGKITAVKNGTVTLTEMLPDGAGCYQPKQATLTMASAAGENDNV